MPNNFDSNVFINCPLDTEYLGLLKPLIFTVYRLGFSPRLSIERSDSGEVRLDKIKSLIRDSKYSIHDLSRIRPINKGDYSRMNMPFEIGLDLGCRDFHGNKKYREKKTLILESERYSSQIGLSDLAGVDPKCHNSNPYELVYQVRTWFSEQSHVGLPSASSVWDDYNIFQSDLYETKLKQGFTKKEIDNLPIVEFIYCIDSWITSQKERFNSDNY